LLRWLAFRGSPPGNLCLPDMIFAHSPPIARRRGSQCPDLSQLA
jgi:hypothetical protein